MNSRPSHGKSNAVVAVTVVVAVLVIAVVAIRVFKDDDSDKAAAKAAVESTRYCELAQQFDFLAASTGAASERDHFDGAPASIGAFVDGMGATLDELATTAPSQIRADVETVVAAVKKAAAGDTSGLSVPAFAKATTAVSTYRQQSCSTAVGVGNGVGGGEGGAPGGE